MLDMKIKNNLVVMLCLIAFTTLGQQPFEKYGYTVKVATLSKGEYQEFFDQDTLVQIGSVVLNTLTGRITHFVTFDTTYSEASLQPELVSRWLSPDPLSEKYYSFSPYNFVANNPILFVDPDGREIWINYGDNQRAKYDNGKLYNEDGSKYTGKDKFVGTTLKSLNLMNADKNGKTVLSALSKSENAFSFKNEYVKDSKGNDMKNTLAFEGADDKKGGVVYAGALMSGNSAAESLRDVAHELFHGYDQEMGNNQNSINGEVQASLFGDAVFINYQQRTQGYFGYAVYGNDTPQGATFDKSMTGLLFGKSFSFQNFNQAINSFKTGSVKNQSANGLYNRFPVLPAGQNPAIKNLYPLVD